MNSFHKLKEVVVWACALITGVVICLGMLLVVPYIYTLICLIF